MTTSGKISATILAEVLTKYGVRHVVCSPGSRNVPLLVAFDGCGKYKTINVVDERSAAFMALGIATTRNEPVALICTSGTALLNYGPAIAEAYYRHLPLIVVSADRPKEWIDQDDSQTLRQFDALRNYVKKSYDIPENTGTEIYPVYVNRIVNDAMITAMQAPCGPVHLNVQFDNPLNEVLPLREVYPRKIDMVTAEPVLSGPEIEKLAEELKDKNILLVCGFMQPDSKINRAVSRFASLPQVTVMAETISNLHLSEVDYSVDSVLCTLSDEEKKELCPDVVITLGGALISRYCKEFLRIYHPAEHWMLGRSSTTVDCFFSLTRRIEVSPAAFLSRLAGRLHHLGSQTDYGKRWQIARERALQSHHHYLQDIPWCDFRAMQSIFKTLPSNCNLHLSNGTPIRYAQLLTQKIPHATFCNRGVSGIDGCTSTALGGALVYAGGDTVLITGDTSFSYDLSALNFKEIPDCFKIIVINNGGGGIFHFIQTTRELDIKERYLMPMMLPQTCESLCEAFGFSYFRAGNDEELHKELPRFFRNNKKSLLEIVTDGELSGEVLRGYMSR